MIYAYGDDIPQLSLWIKRSKSADLDLLVEPERISVSGLDALRSARLLAFPECQFTTERVRFSSDQNEKNTLTDAFSILVELRRIELLSEKTLIGLSPGAVCLLVLPHMTADRQAVMIGSFFLCDRFKS